MKTKIIGAATIIAISYLVGYWVAPEPNEKQKQKIAPQQKQEETTTKEDNNSYKREVDLVYGADEMPESVFLHPFQKTESYIKNKDYIKKLSKEEIEKVQNTAIGALDVIFNVGYREATVNTDVYVENINSLLTSSIGGFERGYCSGDGTFGEFFIENCIDNETNITSHALTAPCMIFKDNFMYVRCMLYITVDGSQEWLNEFLGVQLPLKTEIPLIVDVKVNEIVSNEIIGFEVISQTGGKTNEEISNYRI